ncbi:ABC transporter permease [Metamycoplasma spumans]|uniref:ABC transporter permease n=1 Tax=Metamycoplasma spumans TaxID=92406 RepID=UPI0034DCF085
MFKYIRQRIAFAILTLFIISFFVFMLVATFGPNPLDPVAQDLLKNAKKGETYRELLAKLEVEHGLRYGTEKEPGELVPLIVRYFNYIGNIFTRGDFGFLFNTKNNPNSAEYKNIWQLFFNPLKYTLIITVPTFVLSSILGITIGVIAGYKRGKFFDSASNLFVLVFIAVPSFIIAPLVITIFAKLGVLSIVPRPGSNQPIGVQILAYIPPIMVMTLGQLASYVTYTRNQVITVLTSNYVLIAKTKGLSSTQIFFKYVFRNISIPLFSLIFGSFIGLLSGSIIIERYWQVPGTSQIIVNAFPSGEINVVMFSTLFFTFVSLLSGIIVDISYTLLDPKITYAARSKKNYWLFFKAYLERRRLAKDLFRSNESQLVNTSGKEK